MPRPLPREPGAARAGRRQGARLLPRRPRARRSSPVRPDDPMMFTAGAGTSIVVTELPDRAPPPYPVVSFLVEGIDELVEEAHRTPRELRAASGLGQLRRADRSSRGRGHGLCSGEVRVAQGLRSQPARAKRARGLSQPRERPVARAGGCAALPRAARAAGRPRAGRPVGRGVDADRHVRPRDPAARPRRDGLVRGGRARGGRVQRWPTRSGRWRRAGSWTASGRRACCAPRPPGTCRRSRRW